MAEGALLGQQAATIKAERTRVAAALAALPGTKVFPTQANFVLVRVPDAAGWFERLRAAGILVKSMHGAHPGLAQCLRITIGTPAENDALVAALKTIA
jgi:histidinol-phosphate aminotransferase